MARWMPSSTTEGNNPFLPPAFSLALVIAWIAASVAIIASLCASCHPKPSILSPKSPFPPEKPASSIQDQEQEQEQDQDGTNTNTTPIEEEEGITELEAAIHGPIYPTANLPAGSTSKRRLSVSMSINGVKEGLSRIKTKKEKIGIRGGGEESLWKKTIILGEKCRMQNEEVEGGGEQSNHVDDDTTKMPRSKQVSRNTSFAEEREHS